MLYGPAPVLLSVAVTVKVYVPPAVTKGPLKMPLLGSRLRPEGKVRQ